MSESSDDIAVLQHHLGPQWPGTEADGQTAMVQVLKTVRGYDHAQAETVIGALISAGKLCYHRLGYADLEAMATETVPSPQWDTLGMWLAERRRRSHATAHAGYWEIGNRRANSLGRMGQIDPMG